MVCSCDMLLCLFVIVCVVRCVPCLMCVVCDLLCGVAWFVVCDGLHCVGVCVRCLMCFVCDVLCDLVRYALRFADVYVRLIVSEMFKGFVSELLCDVVCCVCFVCVVLCFVYVNACGRFVYDFLCGVLYCACLLCYLFGGMLLLLAYVIVCFVCGLLCESICYVLYGVSLV